MKASVSVAIAVLILLAAPLRVGAAIPGHNAPKTANYFLHWTVSEGEARELAKWDVLVLDMEVAKRNPDSLRLIRQLNSNIKIVAYITAAEIRQDAATLDGTATLRARLARRLDDAWYVVGAAGDRRTFWSGTWILNLTDANWRRTLVSFVRDDILSSGLWDGVLYDNAWENITGFAGSGVDLNRDGIPDNDRLADESWRSAMRALYRETRAAVPAGMLVMENDGPLYSPETQGILFESFPRGGWATRLAQVERNHAVGLEPRVSVVNTNTENTGRRDDYRKFRFGLSSALLKNAYTSFDFGDQDHGQTWWYDEYDASLGEPIAPARRVDRGSGPGLWQRDFARGSVVVNAQSAPQTVQFRTEVERLRGLQDPATNSGAITDEVTLSGEDGAVLLRPLVAITGAAYRNGSFARVLREDGSALRTGIFAQAASLPGGATVLETDSFLASGANGAVEVSNRSGGKLFRIVPYGARFRGPISLAFGNVVGDASPELVTIPAAGGGAHVKIWDLDGRLRSEFFALDARFQGGGEVAVGDVTGDGRGEIIVGAGAGGAPAVRIFDGNGSVVHNGFLAYAPQFRGGVRVAAGDLDRDGRIEIVTGPGPGGGPHLRVFTASGALRSQFFAFESALRSGVGVGVADIDSDGRLEIIAFSYVPASNF